MSIKIHYNLEKDLYSAYIEPEDTPNRVILATTETIHEAIAKGWHRFIIRLKNKKS